MSWRERLLIVAFVLAAAFFVAVFGWMALKVLGIT